jgi:hypothetical protein
MDSESQKHVRVVPDAVVGGGLALVGGQIVSAEQLGPYLGPLMESGAVVWVGEESLTAH